MLVEKIHGGWYIADIIDGYLFKRRYFGYTKKEALQEFKLELREVK